MNRPTIGSYFHDGVITHTDRTTFWNSDDSLHRTGLYYGYLQLMGLNTTETKNQWQRALTSMKRGPGRYARDTTGAYAAVSRDQYLGRDFGFIALNPADTHIAESVGYARNHLFVNKDILGITYRVNLHRVARLPVYPLLLALSDTLKIAGIVIAKLWNGNETSNRMNTILYTEVAEHHQRSVATRALGWVLDWDLKKFGGRLGVFKTYFHREQDPPFGEWLGGYYD